MAISGGIDWIAVRAAIARWVLAGSGLTTDKVVWMRQGQPRPAAPALTMKISAVRQMTDHWLDAEVNPLTFPAITVTAVDATANTLTKVAHGLLTGDGPLTLASTVTLPAAAPATFWAIKVDADKIKLAASFVDAMTGVFIDLTSVGAGTITIAARADSLRAGSEILYLSRGIMRFTLSLECHATDTVGVDAAEALMYRIASRSALPSQQALLDSVNVGVSKCERVRAIHGVRDAVFFEPRAIMDVHLLVASEESEAGTIIERVSGTNQLTGGGFAWELP